MNREQLIDRKLEYEPMEMIDDIEEHIQLLKEELKYFGLKLDNLYCKD